MSNGQRPVYSEQPSTACPRCASDKIAALPANNPGSDQKWFRCSSCDHLWSQRRDRDDQEPLKKKLPQPSDPPEGEGVGN